MANTGKKIVITLKEVFTDNLEPTGETKINSPDDADYIAPSSDTISCPITYNTSCPTTIYCTNTEVGNVMYEFSLSNSVIKNPNVATVVVKLMSGTTVIDSNSFITSNLLSNYFSDTLITVANGTYTISIDYLNSSNTVVTSCNDIKTVSVVKIV